jgi:hypothetical protein
VCFVCMECGVVEERKGRGGKEEEKNLEVKNN